VQVLPLLENVKNIVLWVDERQDLVREMAEKLGEDRCAFGSRIARARLGVGTISWSRATWFWFWFDNIEQM
jgi:hypothetical protein